MEIQVSTNFSKTVLDELVKQNASKRWLYLQLNMTPQTFEARIKHNDWRLSEIIKVMAILQLK